MSDHEAMTSVPQEPSMEHHATLALVRDALHAAYQMGVEGNRPALRHLDGVLHRQLLAVARGTLPADSWSTGARALADLLWKAHQADSDFTYREDPRQGSLWATRLAEWLIARGVRVEAGSREPRGPHPSGGAPDRRATAKRIADFVANSVMCPEHGYSGPAAPIIDMVDLELQRLVRGERHEAGASAPSDELVAAAQSVAMEVGGSEPDAPHVMVAMFKMNRLVKALRGVLPALPQEPSADEVKALTDELDGGDWWDLSSKQMARWILRHFVRVDLGRRAAGAAPTEET